jgi:hypothetical protein
MPAPMDDRVMDAGPLLRQQIAVGGDDAGGCNAVQPQEGHFTGVDLTGAG